MRLIGNDVDVIELGSDVIIGKYQCRFVIRTLIGTDIYFTNIQSIEDIRIMAFKTVAKIVEDDRTIYVIAPDLDDPYRESYLISLFHGDMVSVVGIKQRIIFDCYVAVKGGIIALGRDFPETFDNSSELMTLYLLIGTNPPQDTNLHSSIGQVTITTEGMFSNGYISTQHCNTTFVMYGECKLFTTSQSKLLHPRTRFVIDNNNIIIAPRKFTTDAITEFLNLKSLPSEVAIYWMDDCLNGNITDILYQLDRTANPKPKFIVCGYDYLTVREIRNYLSAWYKKGVGG